MLLPTASPNVAIKIFLEPFPAPVCKTFHGFPVSIALSTAQLAAAQGMKAVNKPWGTGAGGAGWYEWITRDSYHPE